MSPPPRSRGRPKGGGLSPAAAREAILDATEACFARHGIEKTTVDDIAAEAGCSRSLVYNHFGGRDELVTGVVARITDAYTTSLVERFDDATSLGEFALTALAEVVVLASTDPTIAGMFAPDERAHASRTVAASDAIRARARSFARLVLERAGEHRRAELRDDVDIDEAADHLVFFTLALISGYGPPPDDEAAVRRYLRRYLLPAILRDPEG